MIVKYFNEGVWNYIGNVVKVENKDIDVESFVTKYNKEVEDGTREDVASFMKVIDGEYKTELTGGIQIASDVAMANKVFLLATEDVIESGCGIVNHENLLSAELVMKNFPAGRLSVFVDEFKEALIIITNQSAYLMNDRGQTIERLV